MLLTSVYARAVVRSAFIAVAALSAHNAVAAGSKPPSQDPNVPISRYREHSPGIFRGGRPETAGVKALHEHTGVRTIINLENDMEEVAAERRQAEALGIEYVSSPMSAGDTPVTREIDRLLALINDKSNHPIYIHCHYGKDRTGLVMALHRVLFEGMDPEVAYKEMRDIGFNPIFRKLVRYYKERTGMKMAKSEEAQNDNLFPRILDERE